ncbi:MAG: sulfite exporter TauE/SafE family protein [Hyphomicrobium sp.]
MDMGVMPAELAAVVVTLIAAGIIAGFLAGLLGIGGGGVLVPVLYEVFRILDVDPAIRMHLTLGTTFAIIAPTALRSFAGHRAKGAVDMKVLVRMGPWIVAGVAAGILIAKFSSGITLKWVWATAASLFALKMALGREDWRLGDHLPGRPWLEIVSSAIGCLSTLMSIGGATFVVPFLTLYGRSILRAVATASGVGPMIAIPGALGYMWAGWGTENLPPFSLGYVSLLSALVIVPVSVFAAPFGVRVAHNIPRRRLELAFAAFLACVAVRFFVDLLG